MMFAKPGLTSLPVLLFLVCSSCGTRQGASADPAPATYYAENDFVSVEKVIFHVHIKTFDTAFLAEAVKANFRVLTINNNSPGSPPVEAQQETAIELQKKYPGLLSYITSFPINNWNKPGWQQEALDYMKASIAKGAIGVKIWKNVGMSLKDQNGKFVMVDDTLFDPLLSYLEENSIPLVGHLGEPKNCWLPVDQMTVGSDRTYFRSHPQYHMYLHPEFPSYEDQLHARDRMLDKHPRLHFTGAHLASLEWSMEELAKWLDKYPGKMVDMAERIVHFQYQAVTDWQKVHDFFIRYQDRLIYATDQTVNGPYDTAAFLSAARDTWLRDWKFFTTDKRMRVSEVEGAFNGLRLPREVVDKIYRLNVEKQFPGILAAGKTG